MTILLKTNEFMCNLVDKSFCEVVSFSEIEGQLYRTWYLPHHTIHAKNKLKAVFVIMVELFRV